MNARCLFAQDISGILVDFFGSRARRLFLDEKATRHTAFAVHQLEKMNIKLTPEAGGSGTVTDFQPEEGSAGTGVVSLKFVA
jgi:hypothetical protein